jgi:hypothetical protein
MKKLEATGLGMVALLFFAWPLTHATAPRNFFLVSGAALFGYLAWRDRAGGWLRKLKWPIVLYAVLTIWLVLVVLFLSDPFVEALDELRGQWLKSGLAFLLGAWLASTVGRDAPERSRIITLLVAVLVAQVLYVDLVAIINLTPDGLPRRLITDLGGPDKASYILNLLFAFLLAEVLQRNAAEGRTLEIGNLALSACLLAGLLGVYVAGARNGLVELVAMCAILWAVVVRKQGPGRERIPRKVLVAGAVLLVAVPVLLGYLSLRSDPRWTNLRETVAIAWDTDTHRAWLDMATHPLPRLANGSVVDESAYLRVAWLKEGARLALENPLGVGYGRAAFGRGLQEKYGANAAGHSHSGLLDVALAEGIPGVLLWSAMLASLLVFAIRSFRRNRDYASLLLLAIVSGYIVRMLIDSNVRDHMLQQFLFLAGVLAVMAAVPAARNAPAAPPGPNDH